MKKILLLILMGFGILQLSRAQGSIELVGEGAFSNNTILTTLTFDNPSTITKVVVEAAAIYNTGAGETTGPVKINGSNVNFEAITGANNKTPASSQSDWTYGHFTTTITGPVSSVSLDKNGQGDNVKSFYAYVYRNTGEYSVVQGTAGAAFHNTIADPLVYEFNSLPPLPNDSRDIIIDVPLSDLYSNEVPRFAYIKVTAGAITRTEEFFANNAKSYLRLARVIVPNVPGDVTSVKVEIYSPVKPDQSKPTSANNKDGDSFITGPVVLTTKTMTGPCDECKGGVTDLVLQYDGVLELSSVEVYKKKVDPKKLLASFPNVASGNTISFSGDEKDGKMGTEIVLAVTDVNGNYWEVPIHTSCSQDIYAGMYFDDFLVVGGSSKDGGPLCHKDNIPCAECKGGVISLDLKYTGNSTECNCAGI